MDKQKIVESGMVRSKDGYYKSFVKLEDATYWDGVRAGILKCVQGDPDSTLFVILNGKKTLLEDAIKSVGPETEE